MRQTEDIMWQIRFSIRDRRVNKVLTSINVTTKHDYVDLIFNVVAEQIEYWNNHVVSIVRERLEQDEN